MAKGKNKNKAKKKDSVQSGSSNNSSEAKSNGASSNGIDSGLSSVGNLVDSVGDGELGAIGTLLSKAVSSNVAADEKAKEAAASRLEENIQNLVGELKSEMTKAKAVKRDYESKVNGLQQREEQAILLREEIDTLTKQLKTDQQAVSSEQKNLAVKKSELIDRERDLEAELIDAEAGFSEKNEEMLSAYREEKEKELQAFNDKKQSAREEIDKLNRDISDLKIKVESEHRDKLEEIEEKVRLLEEKELAIEEEKGQLNGVRRKVELGQKMLSRQRESDREEIKSEFLAELERSKKIKEELERQVQIFSEAESEYREKLSEFSKLRDTLGGDSPKEYLKRMEALRKSNEDLRAELDLKPSTDLEESNKRLKEENRDLLQARENQDAEFGRLKTQIRQNRIAVIEKEGLSKENLLLAKQNELLGGRIENLRDEVDDLLSKQESKTAFPALMHMDISEEHNKTATVDKVSSLKTFASELRQRIAWDQETGKELFFREEDIRLFLAGLSMSKLHILQGISGTGKTSLAKAFARAVGGGSMTVSVQAGWRDKDDLIGHYNSFEKKFYERPCLQGLYEAQTPFYADRPYIVLLDEMNLSRPEQYFAEFLSAMELDRKDQQLTLMTSPHSGAPKLFIKDQFLQIPENVWFIGTANHDETTFEFADKTYDRAHVMELPRHEERFDIDKSISPVSYSFSSLEKAFSAAEKKHSQEIMGMLDEINHSDFVETLAQRLGVGWGNRLERQGQRFISTMLASGAKKGEALDHLLATKVLRTGKATGRYDTEREDIEKLSSELKALWSDLGIKDDPVASEKLLSDELRRKSSH